MTWPLALVLLAALLILAYGIREWRRVRLADAAAKQAQAACERTQYNSLRAQGERMEGQLLRLEKLFGVVSSDNLMPVSPQKLHLIKAENIIPFGKKQPDHPDGAA